MDAQCYYGPRGPPFFLRPIQRNGEENADCQELGEAGKKVKNVEDYTFLSIRRVSSEDLMQNMVAMIIIWNCILKLLRVGLKSSQHTQTHMQGTLGRVINTLIILTLVIILQYI